MARRAQQPASARRACATLVCAAIAPLAACTSPRGSGAPLTPGQMPEQVARSLAAEPADAGAFAPVRVRVHPLSRVERTPAGADRASLHVELLDASGLSLRWPMVLGVSMRDGAGRTSAAWADLRTEGASARAFDPVTRTFVLTPAWDDGQPGGANAGARLVGPIGAQVVVVLAPLAPGQEARTLTATGTFGAGARAEPAPPSNPAPTPAASTSSTPSGTP
jgi:hypothetical protein